MRYFRDDHGFDSVATLDIETTHYDPQQGETVSIGVGVHERGTPASEATYELFHRDGNGEPTLIHDAIDWLNQSAADGLVSYKGRDFDLSFLHDRMYLLQNEPNARPFEVALDTTETHIDLFEDRETEADKQGQKWPSLEECIESYGWTPSTTVWGGSPVTNVRFGEELGPAYLNALTAGNEEQRAALEDVVEHYLLSDLEANVAVYYGDIEEGEFEPVHLGSTVEFSA